MSSMSPVRIESNEESEQPAKTYPQKRTLLTVIGMSAKCQ